MQPKTHGLLSRFQYELLSCFFSLPDSGNFYLTGGTALAEYYIGHRKSYDLDLFTAEKSLIFPFSKFLEEEFKHHCQVVVVRRFETFVEFEMGRDDTVKIQLAFDSPFRFDSPVVMADHVVVNDFRDLTVDKFLAFFGRTEPRDAVDIYFILKNVELASLQEMASRKDPGFDPYWLSVAFSRTQDYPDDISRWPVEMIQKSDAREIKNRFAVLAKEVMDSIRTRSR